MRILLSADDPDPHPVNGPSAAHPYIPPLCLPIEQPGCRIGAPWLLSNKHDDVDGDLVLRHVARAVLDAQRDRVWRADGAG